MKENSRNCLQKEALHGMEPATLASTRGLGGCDTHRIRCRQNRRGGVSMRGVRVSCTNLSRAFAGSVVFPSIKTLKRRDKTQHDATRSDMAQHDPTRPDATRDDAT